MRSSRGGFGAGGSCVVWLTTGIVEAEEEGEEEGCSPSDAVAVAVVAPLAPPPPPLLTSVVAVAGSSPNLGARGEGHENRSLLVDVFEDEDDDEGFADSAAPTEMMSAPLGALPAPPEVAAGDALARASTAVTPAPERKCRRTAGPK